jgi:hypothetical protein
MFGDIYKKLVLKLPPTYESVYDCCLAIINELDKSLVSKNPGLGCRGTCLKQGKCRDFKRT